MKEVTLRKFHRYLGVSIALLVVFQVGTGLLLSLNAITGLDFSERVIDFLHFGDGIIGNVYRVTLATTLLFMVATGAWIYMKMVARSRGVSPRRPEETPSKPGAPEERVASLR